MTMATVSLERVCLESQAQAFRFPKVVLSHRSKLTRVIFLQLYQDSDEQGFIELDANQLSKVLGISRRKIYYVVRFLEKVNLLFCKIRRTGRGKHSLFKLNWKKCARTIDRNKFKYHIHDRENSVIRPDNFKSPWNQKMRAFRYLLRHSWFQTSEQELCLGLIGRRIKHTSHKSTKELYHGLAEILHFVDAPNWILTRQDFCKWFMSILCRILR